MSVITLRLPADVKRRLQTLASSRGESLNHLIESIAVQALVAEETARRVWARRSRGSAARALEVLDRVPARKPLPGDGMPRKRPARARRG
jgi:predicted transcriptional regulator